MYGTNNYHWSEHGVVVWIMGSIDLLRVWVRVAGSL